MASCRAYSGITYTYSTNCNKTLATNFPYYVIHVPFQSIHVYNIPHPSRHNENHALTTESISPILNDLSSPQGSYMYHNKQIKIVILQISIRCKKIYSKTFSKYLLYSGSRHVDISARSQAPTSWHKIHIPKSPLAYLQQESPNSIDQQR